MAAIDKIVVITKKTALEELVERFNTRDQARFYLEHMGLSFAEYQQAHDAYQRSLAALKSSLPKDVRHQFVERAFLPTFTFGDTDLVVTLGPDGLVVNTAKYLNAQPLLAFNPDPQRVDGILVTWQVQAAEWALRDAVQGRSPQKHVSMAKVELNDGQALYAVNDLFIGQQTHVSARYALRHGPNAETQSSSGLIVSTGAGSTGWFRSILTGATEIVEAYARRDDLDPVKDSYRFDWEANYLYYSVREPFVSKTSSAKFVFGRIEAEERLLLTSQMPQNGVIFSDGIEEDYLPFNSGAIAEISLANKKVHLIVPR